MALCRRLGIDSFIPRSYIEQVQILRLTESFAEMTDKARRHFSVGDDVIIDDHVIGSSPARRLNALGPVNALRHSTDHFGAAAAVAAAAARMASEPLKQALGWPTSTAGGAGASPAGSAAVGLGSRSDSRELPDGHRASGPAALPSGPSQLSRDMEALSLEGRRSGSSAALKDAGAAMLTGPLAVHDGAARATAWRHPDVPGTSSPPAPPADSVAGRTHTHDALASSTNAVPAWVPNGATPKPPDPVAFVSQIRGDLHEIVVAMQSCQQPYWHALIALGTCAGFAAGLSCALLFKRS
jgi:hypothetical protein